MHGNLEIALPLVNGDLFPLEITGAEVVRSLVGDDLRPPPRSVYFRVRTDDGKQITINIPNDERRTASVNIESA